MRVALVLPGFSAHTEDWAIPALLNLALDLAQADEVHVFSQRYPAGGTYRFGGLTHHALGGGQQFGLASLKIWLQTSRMIIRQHRQTPFDLVHAFWADEAGFSAALAGARLGRPVVVSLGGGELTHLPEINYGAQRFWIRRLTTWVALRRAARVTAGSTYQLDLGRAHGIPGHKLALAPLGVDTGRFSPDWDADLSPPTLIQAASLLPVKNQVLLLQVLHLARQRLPDLQLHLAGEGPERNRLVELAYKLDLRQNIHWLGQVPHVDTPTLYHHAQLYLQTSRHESQGIAVLEAMACGLPVIGTPVGVARDLACLPATVEPEVLAEQIWQVFSQAGRYTHWRHQARQQVEQGFSREVASAKFRAIYESLR